MVNLVPSADSVMKILTETGAYRHGHFIYPNGKHASHYFQMPLAFRVYDNARILAVGLSRLFRMEKSIRSFMNQKQSAQIAERSFTPHLVFQKRISILFYTCYMALAAMKKNG